MAASFVFRSLASILNPAAPSGVSTSRNNTEPAPRWAAGAWMRAGRRLLGALLLGALLLGGAALGYAQDDTSAAVRPRPTPSRLVDPIDERALVTLKGNVRADVAHAPDLGAVEDAKPLNLFLLLQRSTAQQADLDSLIARQQEPGAPEYHKWLTPAEFGARFGASPQDITKLSTWLQSHGFKIRSVLNNASMIDFEATAGQVREAFHAQLHYVSVRGGKYPALRQDPQIPAALIPVVAGIEGLNKIPPQANHGAPRHASRDQATHRWHIVNPTPADTASPDYSDGSGDYLVGPQDLYTIYKINPVFTGGNLAATATVAVIEQSDIEYGTVTSGVATGGDVATFRSVFGVPGTLNMHVYHGYGSVTCNDPGITYADEFEASIDAEWINATAPSANLIFMSCDDDPDDGILSSMTALIDNNLSDAMSLSYGESELDYTSANYTFQDDLYEQAATQGQSAVISAGDGGSDVADTHGVATVGVNVSGLSSSPLVTSAGGTDFQDYYDAQENGKPQSTYWNSTNSTYYGDAISYIPETAWNQSCAGSLIAELAGYPGAAYCAYFGTVSPFEGSGLGGSGGISTHYAAPAWQTGISGYSNPMRSQPDIAGFASSFWFHALLLCDSNPDDGDPCTSPSTFGASDGTSFVAPYTAGEVGLLVAATGSRQGVLNPALYALAKAQYAAPATATACYANGQTSNTGVTTSLPAAACIFNDVTTGNNDVPCTAGSTDCFANSGASYGILSLTGSSSLTVAYASAAGYDQVTGIGSVNVANLIADWNTAFTSNTALQANPTSINSSQSTDLTATVTGGTPTGYVDAPPAVTGTITFKAGTTVVGNCTLSSGTCNATVLASSLQMGANSMTAIFGGSGTYPSFTSSIVTVTVETSSLITPTVTATPSSLSITTTQALSVTVVVSGGSGNPVPTGTVTLSGGGYSSAATTLSGGSAAINIGAGSMAMGSDTLTVTYTPDASSSTIYNSSTGSAVVVVTTQVTPTISWTPASAIILGSPGTNVLNATVSCGTTCGGITYTATPSGGSPVGITSTSGLALGVYTITANFTPLNPSEYNATSVSSTLTVSGESVWIVDGGGGTGELAGNGAAITSSADTGETTAVAIDAGGNVWTVGSGSLDETSQVGTVQNTVSSGSGGLHLPAAIAIDGNSQVWVTNGNNSVSLFSNAGTALSPSTGFTDSSLSTPTGIAIDPGGSVWIANKGNNSVTRILGGAAPAAPLSTAAANNTIGAKP